MSEFRIDQIKSQDATRGPDVAGITTFTGTSGIVMPSGDTAYRGGRGRGLFNGAYDAPATRNTIDYITIATLGNALDFGDLSVAKNNSGSVASSIRGVIGGGRNPAVTNHIDYVTISSTGNGFEFGDLTQGRRTMAAMSNSSRGIWAGGDSPSRQDIIDFVTISTTSNAVDFGDLSEATNTCLLYTSPSPRDAHESRMPSSA